VINVPVGIATLVVGARLLRESRAGETARPGVPGAMLLAGATGALALALVQGDAWGWDSAATLGAFGGALVAGGLLAARTRRIAAPVLDRPSCGRAANAGTMAFGAALFAVALLWVVVAAGSTPDFFGVWLPYGVIGGAGIGLGLPALIGATAAGLPPGRFATGMALATTARQLGAVIGVALLVAVVGTPAPGDAGGAYHAGFALCAGALAVAAACAGVLGRAPEAVAARGVEPAVA
jgi:hypothetical protein